jgi:type I restriction enzyme M protein
MTHPRTLPRLHTSFARAFREARERLLTDFAVIAVVRLPVGTFSGAPDVRTNILFIKRDVQPDTIRYYHVPRRAPRSSLHADLPSDALEGALAWVLDGTRDRYSWEVSVSDVKQGNWSLDIPWPGITADGSEHHKDVHHGNAATEIGEQMSLLQGSLNTCPTDRMEMLGQWIEKRGAPVRHVDGGRRFMGVYQHGLGPAKGKRAAKTDLYRRLEINDLVYNPMRAAQGAFALCRSLAEEGLVSPGYVVFRLRDGAPVTPGYVLSYLKSSDGRREVESHSHGSLRRRLRYKDLEEILLPVPSQDRRRRSVKW